MELNYFSIHLFVVFLNILIKEIFFNENIL